MLDVPGQISKLHTNNKTKGASQLYPVYFFKAALIIIPGLKWVFFSQRESSIGEERKQSRLSAGCGLLVSPWWV